MHDNSKHRVQSELLRELTLISDFNTDILSRYLSNSVELPGVSIRSAPYGQVIQNLLATEGDDQQESAVFVWTLPESVLKSYGDVLLYKPVDHDVVLEEMEHYIDVLESTSVNVKYLFHSSWVVPVGERGYGMLDYSEGLGLANLTAKLNLRISERLKDMSNVFILNTENWLRTAGPRSAPAKMWFASKVPYNNVVFREAAQDVGAALQGLAGKAKKLVIVDLDNTLWGGIVGESGWRGIRLGGHDYTGEAFVYFQKRLKALAEKGIQLGIVSKNDESAALEALDLHPEMYLKRTDFAGWRINWMDKAQNIVDLVGELNLGLDAVVFLDDNPAERARVSEALEDVLVPDWPSDPSEYGNALLALKCFDAPAPGFEDRNRVKMYSAEQERRGLQKTMSSPEDWLASLDMDVKVEALTLTNLPRVVQLMNKTNQMNMRTRRVSEQELQEWMNCGNRQLWTFRLSDRFGDSGICGIISVEMRKDAAYIVDFVMSCRVMGRQLEKVMIHIAVNYANQKKPSVEMVAEYLQTDRNRPCLEFWRTSGFNERQGNRFFWKSADDYPGSAFIQLDQVEDNDKYQASF